MAINMKETLKMGKHMARESTNGQMEKCMMENGGMESKKAMEFGKEYSEIATSVSGRILKLMAMVFISGRMETDMRESGKTVLSMGKELTYLQIKTAIQELINLVNPTDMVNINGKMVPFMWVISKMV